MKQHYLLASAVLLLGACQHERDIAPDATTLAGQVAGTYQTNAFVSPLCLAIPDDKMPVAEVRTESDSEVTLLLRSYYPVPAFQVLQHVRLSRQPDQSVQLLHRNEAIGSVRPDRAFTANGMEISANVLRVLTTQPDAVMFTGYKK